MQKPPNSVSLSPTLKCIHALALNMKIIVIIRAEVGQVLDESMEGSSGTEMRQWEAL